MYRNEDHRCSWLTAKNIAINCAFETAKVRYFPNPFLQYPLAIPETPMAVKVPTVLLVAETLSGVSALASRLARLACEIQFAPSASAAVPLTERHPIDLILCEFRMRVGRFCPLVAALIGSPATLLYSYPVRTGCWWLPAVKNGQSCWGAPAMRSPEFIRFLKDFLSAIRLGAPLRPDEISGNVFELSPERTAGENIPPHRDKKLRGKSSVDAA